MSLTAGPRPRYPKHVRTALVIDTSWSYCGACGRGAFPNQQTHQDVAGYSPEPGGGCGIQWDKVTSSYAGPRVERAVRSMRPDLEWVEMYPAQEVR